MAYLLVFVGGGLGALARHGVARAGLALGGAGVPLATMAVNVLGSLAMGIAAGVLARHPAPDPLRLFAVTGVLGGFTTFSAFSNDTVALWQRGEGAAALAYAGGSVMLSLAALALGLALAR